jgi:5-dehydro-2-deoxygluconokinase
MAPFDLITTGRVGVDFYPQPSGVSLAEVETFAKYLGGSATNVSVQAARLGSRSAVVTKVGDDPFGPFVRTALERFGSTRAGLAPIPRCAHTIRAANAAGAIAASRLACADDFPTLREIDEVLHG